MTETLFCFTLLNLVAVALHYLHPWDPDFEPSYNEATASLIALVVSCGMGWLSALGWLQRETLRGPVAVLALTTFIGAGVLFHVSPPVFRLTRNARGKLTTVDIVPRSLTFMFIGFSAIVLGVWRVFR